jgi:hypothetical protein
MKFFNPTIDRSLYTCGWKIHGANTYRLSSAKLLGNWGGNCQNPDNRLMERIIPRPGNLFLQCDQAGAEALIMAHLARPGRMRELFKCGIKPHTYLALHIFIKKYAGTADNPHPKERYWMKSGAELKALPEWKALDKLIKNSDKEYAIGKMTCHAKNYDMKWMTFIINVLERTDGEIVLSASEGKTFLEMFDQVFPEIIELQDEIRGIVQSTRTLRNLFGHPKRFVQPLRSSYERQWLAFIPQSTVGVLAVRAAIGIRNELKKEKLDQEILLVNNKHDSLLLDCPPKHEQYGVDLLQRHMAQELQTPKGETFRMGVEVSKGYSWSKNGMKNI